MNPIRAIRADTVKAPPHAAPEFDLTNVVPFARREGAPARTAPPISVAPADRPTAGFAPKRARLAALIVCSAAAHAALYLPFAREPEPMASLGEMVISAELVIGTNTPAGPLDERGQAEASAPEPARAPEPAIDKPNVELAQPAPSKPEIAPAEPPAVVKPAPAEPEQVAALAEPPEQPAVKPQAPVEPELDHPPATAEIPAPPQVADRAELQASLHPPPSDQTAPAAPPEAKAAPDARPPPPSAAPPPKPAAKPQPRRPEKPKAETRRASLAGTPNDARSTAPAATSAAGAGRGRSDADSNYAGLVAAHLARFRQFPSDARSRGDQGRATVTFSLAGGGGVTSVRLTRGTGVASLDAEATAMVRRASPFPPPPSGRPQSFTVPVNFRLN
jgi:periplasmic protein TonB